MVDRRGFQSHPETLRAASLGVQSQRARQFAQEHGLPFTLLADSTKETAKTYGVLRSVLGLMEIARRETFIIDPQGRIAKHYSSVDPKGHSQMVLADLKALQAKS